jgi:TolA-binding protein
MGSEGSERGRGLFGYRRAVVQQIISDRDVMLRQAEGRVRAAESRVSELEQELNSMRDRGTRMEEQLERLRALVENRSSSAAVAQAPPEAVETVAETGGEAYPAPDWEAPEQISESEQPYTFEPEPEPPYDHTEAPATDIDDALPVGDAAPADPLFAEPVAEDAGSYEPYGEAASWQGDAGVEDAGFEPVLETGVDAGYEPLDSVGLDSDYGMLEASEPAVAEPYYSSVDAAAAETYDIAATEAEQPQAADLQDDLGGLGAAQDPYAFESLDEEASVSQDFGGAGEAGDGGTTSPHTSEITARFLTEELAGILTAAEESAARIVERAQASSEEQLAEANRLWREVQEETARFAEWRNDVEPIIERVREKLEDVRERVQSVPERIREALAPMADAISAVDGDLAELAAAAATPPVLITPVGLESEGDSSAGAGPDDAPMGTGTEEPETGSW